MTDNLARKFVAPVPATFAEWVRKTEFNRTNNDRVEDLHIKLLNDPKTSGKYIETLQAVTDAEAVEGSLAIDNADAARMIRDLARNSGDRIIGSLKLKAIVTHLNVVLKRYGMLRSQRLQMIGGKAVHAQAQSNSENVE